MSGCVVGLVVGRGLPWPLAPGPWPLLLCAISRRVAAIAHSGAFPGPQALPEQQDTSCPRMPLEGGSLSRGKDTLFRPGHLPGLGLPCPRPGGQSKALPEGGSQ